VKAAVPTRPEASATPAARIDIRGQVCPLTWVRTRIALGRIRPGEVLEVLLREGEPLENVPLTARQEGHRTVKLERAVGEEEGIWCVWLERGAPDEESEWL
jgi:TusA-related sulfurtransferase